MGVRTRLTRRFVERLTPERTRRPTLFERLTVCRMSWETLVRLNGWLEFVGRIATALWVATIAALLVGLDLKTWVEDAVNSGRPVKQALLLSLFLPTLVFLAARSAIGLGRWRLQRELWRRDVQKLRGADEGIAA